MIYPTIAEYVDAILSAEDNLDKLNNLRPVLDGNGRPVMSSGNYAVVFKMTDGDKCYALKCFTKEQEGRDEAYRMIVDELEFVQSSYIVPIKYLPNELFVSSNNTNVEEFPVVQMEWVEGENLDAYIRDNINDEYALNLLAYQFSRLAMWLLSQPFAHSDLKPDNILVRPDGTLVLVDYDGMYVPAMRGMKSREIGSPDYCHPLRTADNFNEHTDDFSIAVIALSLKAIVLNPDLLNEKSDGSLIFHSADYRDLSKCEAISSIHSLLNNSEIERLYSLFLLAHSQNELPQSSFRLFTLERPEKPEYEDLSTEVTDEDIANGVTDEYGVIYSKDGKRLLKYNGTLDNNGYTDFDLKIYNVKEGTIVICDSAFEVVDVYGGEYDFEIGAYQLIKINLPKTLMYIGGKAFFGCYNLKNVSFPDSLQYIGEKAFFNCWRLVCINNFPKGISQIGFGAFNGCDNLELQMQLSHFNINNGILYDKNYHRLISCWGEIENVEIPSTVKIIGNYALSNMNIKKINIPNGVTTIGEGAFSYCSITNINIPNSIVTIGNLAFVHCGSLQTVILPNDITSIGDSTFSECFALESINIPQRVTSIGDYAFNSCTSMAFIEIPNGVTSIGKSAFMYCDSLKKIIIPEGVTFIGKDAFWACDSLKKIIIPKGFMEHFKSILANNLHSKLIEQ